MQKARRAAHELRHEIAELRQELRQEMAAHPWQLYLVVGSLVSMAAAVGVIMVGYQNEEVRDELLSLCRGVGLQPLIDVTIPYEATFSEVMAVGYSFVPWAVSGVIVGCALVKRTTRWLASMAYICLVILCNEVFVKRSFPQKRPLASCLVSPGMPSSHSVISIGLLVWFLLERVDLRDVKGMSFDKPWKGLAALLVLAPVPPSRVVLNDHSLAQVTAGSLMGVATALAFFNLMRSRVAPSLNDWCEHPYAVRFGVTNDYTKRLCVDPYRLE
eukprot:TRINITY_DN2631_c0_g1_i1.p1 TRINITY_DN2631_c0_g1~~TRINITY_DN2631_c0_g1_i1.p1  ORF type:complete len:272 (+),score=94.87 TRINITY_DN2631_c0_g1_i1:50-865(+)